MPRARLIVWNPGEVAERQQLLVETGLEVDASELSQTAMRSMRSEPPDVVVIDLGRLPSQGRDLGIWLRCSAATRRVPLVFVGGAPSKVEAVREHLPDATFADWSAIGPAVAGAIANPPSDPVVPASVMAGYSGAPLLKKLGIKSGSVVALVDAPAGFEAVLGELPAEARLERTSQADGADLTIWFVQQHEALESRLDEVAARLGRGGLWIAWPKKTSKLAGDLTQQQVRETGLAHGLVDYKICAIDETWSGLRFTRRQT